MKGGEVKLHRWLPLYAESDFPQRLNRPRRSRCRSEKSYARRYGVWTKEEIDAIHAEAEELRRLFGNDKTAQERGQPK